jgi:hypothetical protein
MRILADGKVGIGADAPTATLDVGGGVGYNVGTGNIVRYIDWANFKITTNLSLSSVLFESMDFTISIYADHDIRLGGTIFNHSDKRIKKYQRY